MKGSYNIKYNEDISCQQIDLERKECNEVDIGGSCTEFQHFVALFGLCNPHSQSADFNIKRGVQDRLKILYQEHKGNEDNNWPYEGDYQKLSSEILCAHGEKGNILL